MGDALELQGLRHPDARLTGVLRYEILHLERLKRRGLLVLANHPTLIDVVFLMSLLENPDCIVKDKLAKNPFTRFAIGAAGLILNSRGGEALVEDCAASMAEGNNLLIFPEGSRSEASGMIPLQRGAAHVAVRAKKDVTPVLIRVNEHNLGRSSKWWMAPPEQVHLVFEVMEDIPVLPFIEAAGEAPGAARDLTQHLSLYFSKELEAHGTYGRP
jgi:1-acyl-sn-glycerol-3-phosphate acyltransferase